MRFHSKLRVAILGTGNIGTDLLLKTLRSPSLECTLFSGRNLASPRMAQASKLGVRVSDRGVEAILDDPDCCDLVFDATSANDHLRHWGLLQPLRKTVIDLTPAGVGALCIPSINLEQCLDCPNINMVTCGGQAAIPLAHLIGQTQHDVEYIEVVSTIASKSAGPATRINLDEYVHNTERGIRHFCPCRQTKSILILNPAQPCIDMQATVFAKVPRPDLDALRSAIDDTVERIRSYVPGYRLVVRPSLEDGRVVITARVQGLGDFLPKYAGNLDIINCAAIATAEKYARRYLSN
jgi:acetaldehyde dehydrogenase